MEHPLLLIEMTVTLIELDLLMITEVLLLRPLIPESQDMKPGILLMNLQLHLFIQGTDLRLEADTSILEAIEISGMTVTDVTQGIGISEQAGASFGIPPKRRMAFKPLIVKKEKG